MSHNEQRTAADVIELIASRATSSSSLFVYDLAEQVGFGLFASTLGKTTPVIRLQTRAGAGLGLIGRLSQGTSRDGATGSILSAFTTPVGFAAMVPSLVHLPTPTPDSRLILQVPTVTPIGDSFTFSPTLASLNSALPVLPEAFSIILSATPQESVDLAAAAYQLPTHVIHLFDHYDATREVTKLTTPSLPAKGLVGPSVQDVLKQAGYSPFEYSGDKDAHTVLVLLNGPLALIAKSITKNTPGIAVVAVRVLRPWDESALRSVLPPSVTTIHVVEDAPYGSVQGALFGDVFSSLYDPSGPAPSVYSKLVAPEQLGHLLDDPSSAIEFFSSAIGRDVSIHPNSVLPDSKLLFFSTPGSVLSEVPQLVEQTFTPSTRLSSRLLTQYDIFSKPGGVKADRILLSPKDIEAEIVPLSYAIPLSSRGSANFLAILDQNLLKSHRVLDYAKEASIVLIATTWSAAELVSTLHADTLALIRDRRIRLCTIDSKDITAGLNLVDNAARESVQPLIVQLAFLRLYFGTRATEEVVLKVVQDMYGRSAFGLDLAKINAKVWTALKEVDPVGANAEEEQEQTLKDFSFNAIAVSNEDGKPVVNGAKLDSWHEAAKHLLFPNAFTPPNDTSEEEYPQIPSLRPELPERTFLVTCSINRRLTPLDYDRNVFHLEFDTSGTGLKYAIGEALGVHGWNDEGDVLDFCNWYGVDSTQLITLPVPGLDGRMHTRSVFQALQQQIDLFGKPPRSFYTDLADHATNTVDKYALQFIGSAEGMSMFKKLSEKDTVTFADVLKRYKSARPSIELLCEMIGDIKPRHYSIASAQSVVGDRVDLLIVTVEWSTPSGSPRYGQCTRYLAGLKIGQKVTVSIKPSVMKLPADDKQPLIMAGLGTGAAPFRAFLQHRAMLAEKNVPVGPAYYYFGSRHQSQEYLYGEEIEAFIRDGVITKAGLAFSRDGPKKVYIQQKMLEDSATLAHMLREENGVFYLCGPTWPVPDVFEALRSALVKHHGLDLEGAAEYLESLKEEERYVLEVY